MRKDKVFDIFGVNYRTRQFTAVPALAMMAKDGDLDPCEMLEHTQVQVGGKWLKLSDPDNINQHVVDKADIVAPRMALNAVLSVVNDFNFGFLYEWKGVRVPPRLVDESQSVVSDHADPMVSHLVQGGAATLRELEEYYSLEDAFKMFDILTAKGVNQALSQEHAHRQAKSKGR